MGTCLASGCQETEGKKKQGWRRQRWERREVCETEMFVKHVWDFLCIFSAKKGVEMGYRELVMHQPSLTKKVSYFSSWGSVLKIVLKYGEQKTEKEKLHKGIWRWECPGSVPGINSGRPRDTRDVWAGFYVEIQIQWPECPRDRLGRMSADRWRDRWDMSTGQTGHKPGVSRQN